MVCDADVGRVNVQKHWSGVALLQGPDVAWLHQPGSEKQKGAALKAMILTHLSEYGGPEQHQEHLSKFIAMTRLWTSCRMRA